MLKVKQVNTGPFLGGLKDLLNRTLSYMGIVNFLLIAITAYSTTLKAFFQEKFPWISFPLYLGILVVIFLVAMVFEFVFVIPSIYTFLNKQEYDHKNLIRKDLEEVKRLLYINRYQRIRYRRRR